jgi:hypothetical protein
LKQKTRTERAFKIFVTPMVMFLEQCHKYDILKVINLNTVVTFCRCYRLHVFLVGTFLGITKLHLTNH